MKEQFFLFFFFVFVAVNPIYISHNWLNKRVELTFGSSKLKKGGKGLKEV